MKLTDEEQRAMENRAQICANANKMLLLKVERAKAAPAKSALEIVRTAREDAAAKSQGTLVQKYVAGPVAEKVAVVKTSVAEIIREARGADGADFDPAVRGSFPSNTMPAPSSAAIEKAQLSRTKLQTNEQPTVADYIHAASSEALRAQAEAGNG